MLFRPFFAIIYLLSVLAPGLQAAPAPAALRPAVECLPRQGLPNFLPKIKAGQAKGPLKVAYLGGSITAAPGWRVKSLAWLKQTFPAAKFEEINATIGGTGSDLGVFRLGQDVTQHHPDLMFVEFAVNDHGAQREQIHQCMEGITRQLWRSLPETDICFVYTISEPGLKDLQAGNMQGSATAMEDVADHYGIPSIHFGVEVAAQLKRGELVFNAPKPDKPAETKPWVFSSDGVHPHVETGHEIYTQCIVRSWPQLEKASGHPKPHALPAPLDANNWEQAKLVPITEKMLSGAWTTLPPDDALAKSFGRFLPVIRQATAPGATLHFKVKGRAVGSFDLLGPDGGQLEIGIAPDTPENKGTVKVNLIDGYCTYSRLSKHMFSDKLEPSTSHDVTVTLTATRLDKRSLLFEKNRAFFDANAAKYAPDHWNLGSLMVIGEISDP